MKWTEQREIMFTAKSARIFASLRQADKREAWTAAEWCFPRRAAQLDFSAAQAQDGDGKGAFKAMMEGFMADAVNDLDSGESSLLSRSQRKTPKNMASFQTPGSAFSVRWCRSERKITPLPSGE